MYVVSVSEHISSCMYRVGSKKRSKMKNLITEIILCVRLDIIYTSSLLYRPSLVSRWAKTKSRGVNDDLNMKNKLKLTYITSFVTLWWVEAEGTAAALNGSCSGSSSRRTSTRMWRRCRRRGWVKCRRVGAWAVAHRVTESLKMFDGWKKSMEETNPF